MKLRELKKRATKKMVKTRAQKQLWDDYLELDSYIHFNTALDIIMVGREVSETVMSEETSDISQNYEHS